MFLHYRKKNLHNRQLVYERALRDLLNNRNVHLIACRYMGVRWVFRLKCTVFFLQCSTVKKYSAPYFFGRKFIPPHIFTDDIGGIGGYISPPPPPHTHTHTRTQTYTPQLCSIYFFTIVFLSTFCYMILEGVEKCTFSANVFGYHHYFHQIFVEIPKI